MKYKTGIIIFAENNEQINYVQIAKANALMVKHHMGVNVSLITSSDVVCDVFDNIIRIDQSDEQKKAFVGYGKYEKLSYFNSNRTLAYELSPYDETILIDSDYLILDDSLNLCWGINEPILINHKAIGLYQNELHIRERRLFDTNIPMSWATVVYFKKCRETELFFNLVKLVQKNYHYYSNLFNVPAGLYRNDYAFSIASHLFGNLRGDLINSLPDNIMLTSNSVDKIMKISIGEIDVAARVNEWHYPVKMKQNFHFMNKFDLNDRSEEIIEIYR